MKAIPRRAILWLLAVAAAGVAHAITGRMLAEHDLVAAVIRVDLRVVLAAAALMISRLFLYLLAPGWALYIATRTLIERLTPRRAARARTARLPGG